MKSSLLLTISYIIVLQAGEIRAKAGKKCVSTSDCNAGIQICNERKLCECKIVGRQSPKILRLLEVCKLDTHKQTSYGQCLYGSQCTDLGPKYGCIEGMCRKCDNYHNYLNNDRTICLSPSTTTPRPTTEAPLTEEELDELQKALVKRIIVICTSVCCVLAALGLIVAMCRIACGKKKRSIAQEAAYFDQSHQTDIEDACPSIHRSEFPGDDRNAGIYDLNLPDYADTIGPANNFDNLNNSKMLPLVPNTPTAPEASPNSWNRWLAPVTDGYDPSGDLPPPYNYDLDKNMSKGK